MYTEIYLVLKDTDELTSRYTNAHADGTVSVWPTWNSQMSLRINGTRKKMIELRDMIDAALAKMTPVSTLATQPYADRDTNIQPEPASEAEHAAKQETT